MSQFKKQITLLDKTFSVVGDPIKAFESLSYSDAWEQHGALSLVVGSDEFTNIKLAAWLKVDGRVYENETHISNADALTVKVMGASLSVLFDRIVITADERLQGRLEERVAYLVNKYAVTGAQRVVGLVLGADNGFKRAMDINVKRGQTLSEVLYTALPQRGYSFEIVLLSDSSVQFNVLQAADRTQHQSVNPPVTMSTRAEIEKAEYKYSQMDHRNFAVVCDEDDTAPQTVEVDLSNGDPVRAMYVSGRSAGADDSAAPNQFVFAGQYTGGVGFIGTSTDGQNLTNRVTSGIPPVWSVKYINGMFVAGTNGGSLLSSLDAVSWTPNATGAATAIESALFDEGVYCVGGLGFIRSSYDLVSWGVFTTSSGGGTVRSLYKGKMFTAIVSPPGTPRYVYILRSEFGADWTEEILVELSSATTLVLFYESVGIDSRVVSVGFVTISSVDYPVSVVSDDDGASFSYNVLSALSGKRFLGIAAGLGIFVAVGQPNTIQWSEDGETWTDCTPPGAGTPDWIAVCFDSDNGVFHAYSATTKHHAYGDGKTWTRTTFTTSAGLIDAVVYGTSSHTGNLYQIGVDALTEAAIVETLDGDVNTELAPVYKTDYNVGDTIDAVDPDHGIAAAKRVLEVEFLVDRTTDLSIIPKLGKDSLSLRQLIAKEIKNNGI